MSKQADRYFLVEPWRVVERGFDAAHGEVAESIFSLGNEYMGLRGYFEEGYSGKRLLGSYLGGVYERMTLPAAHYRGMPPFVEMMINAVDWVHTRIVCNGEALDLATSRFRDFSRALDLRTGVLTRGFVWQVDEQTTLRLTFERFVSMARPQYGGQRVRAEALSGEARISISAGLDFSPIHQSTGRNHWDCRDAEAEGDVCRIFGQTQTTRHQVFAAALFRGMGGAGAPETGEKRAALRYEATLARGDTLTLERLVTLLCDRDYEGESAFREACAHAPEALRDMDYDALQSESAAWWARQWAVSDIEIDGDDENQQGIRYGIFQLHQTLHTADRSAIIGAKGLTGEAYSGNAFWDSEVYCLPFYLLNNPRAARNILQFRCDTLPQAQERARALDLSGAFYPIATISGHECCNLWQHASLQLQASTAVAYGLWHYAKVTGDRDFLYRQGARVLIEICRMLDSRGAYSQTTGKHGFYGVMGPDEFQLMVNNNAYTNLMAKRTFDFTLQTLTDMEREAPDAHRLLIDTASLSPEETARWRRKSADMLICADGLLFEQHEGFFDLPHVDVSAIPVEEFPLYDHWAYDRLYRNDMIKQPDVLMFMFLFGSEFSDEQLAVNFDYYEPRCIHESSLSPSVHSILAARLGRMEQAYAFFGFATRLDLDNYNRNTREGLHTTAIAASWMNIVYGFGGLRTDGEGLALWPVIPDAWTRYRFSLQYRGVALSVEATKEGVTLRADRDDGSEITLYGKPVRPTRAGLRMPLTPRPTR